MLLLCLLSSIAYINAAASSQHQLKPECIPRCCGKGQILDPSGRQCLKDPSNPVDSADPCGRRDSFLPACEDKPVIMQQGRPQGLQHSHVLRGLSKYSIGIHGETIESFYEDFSMENKANRTTSLQHKIPSSFCIDPDNEKVLVCPRVSLEKGTTVYKCCPFGKALKYPLFSGCEASTMENSGDWGVPVQGRRLPMADLIRFPSESLRYDKNRNEQLASDNPCEGKRRLLYDYEAFQVDRHGSLVFSRSLGFQRLDDFCLDSINFGGRKNHVMVAVFCQPDNVTHLDESLQKLILPNAATAMLRPATHFMPFFLSFVILLHQVMTVH